MDVTRLLLICHLLGAGFTGIFIIKAVRILLSQQSSQYKTTAMIIGYSAFYQMTTGSLLAVSMQKTYSLQQFCTSIGIYLSIIVVIESILFKRMRENSLPFPLKIVSSSLITGSLVTVIVILGIYV